MINARIITLVLTLTLGACASGPQYVEADHAGDRGYSSRKIDDTHYRVVYNGGRRADLETARDYALLHAAEVTLKEGYEWFRIVDRDSHTRTSGGEDPRFGLGYRYGYGYGYDRAEYVERNCGVLGCTTRVRPASYSRWEIAGNTRRAERHSHSIEIVLGKGEPPADGNYYDAKSVISAVWSEM